MCPLATERVLLLQNVFSSGRHLSSQKALVELVPARPIESCEKPSQIQQHWVFFQNIPLSSSTLQQSVDGLKHRMYVLLMLLGKGPLAAGDHAMFCPVHLEIRRRIHKHVYVQALTAFNFSKSLLSRRALKRDLKRDLVKTE